MRSSRGGGQAGKTNERLINSSDIALPEGYTVTPIATTLSFPTAVSFDDKNQLYVIEAGYSYGEIFKAPQLLRIESNGSKTLIAKGDVNGPWTGIVFHKGFFYVAEGGAKDGGKILRISKSGEIKVLIDSLPSVGDHHTNGPAIKDGYIYFGQGTATNSGVVGKDNFDFGWLMRKPKFHDIPCYDITLEGTNFTSSNVLTTDNADDKAVTGAFVPFNTETTKGQVIKGSVPCTGAIMRIPLEGGKPEVVAWGLRNPFGLSFNSSGDLYVTENGYDERGSRPVWGTGDVLWKIEPGAWYGWPDYSAGKSVYADEEFKSPLKTFVKPLLANAPSKPPKPVSIFGVHASADGIDFSISDQFGFKGQAFVAEFGDMAPKVGKVLAPVGFRVVRVDVSNGAIEEFASNKGRKTAPATWLKTGGLERPVSVKFSPDGNTLYVVDFGIMRISDLGPRPVDNTGVIWKIVKK